MTPAGRTLRNVGYPQLQSVDLEVRDSSVGMRNVMGKKSKKIDEFAVTDAPVHTLFRTGVE